MRRGSLADLVINWKRRIRVAINPLPTCCCSRMAARNNPASSSVVRLIPGDRERHLRRRGPFANGPGDDLLPSRPVALVSGAAQGLGHTIGQRLARDGFAVAVNDLVSDSRVESLPVMYIDPDPRNWWHQIDVNLSGHFRLVQAVAAATRGAGQAGSSFRGGASDAQGDRVGRVEAPADCPHQRSRSGAGRSPAR